MPYARWLSDSTKRSGSSKATNALAPKEFLACVLQPVDKVLSRSRRRQWFAVLPIEIYGLFHNLAKLLEDMAFIVTVTASQDKAWRAADIAAVFFGPFDDFRVPCTILHFQRP